MLHAERFFLIKISILSPLGHCRPRQPHPPPPAAMTLSLNRIHRVPGHKNTQDKKELAMKFL